MKPLKLITAAAAAAVIFTAAASAETINTIEQVEETALLNNLDYKTAVLEVMKAENALESYLQLDTSSLTLSGSYSSDSSDGSYGWNASASLPVFEQLSLSASIDEELDGTFGISLTPLSHSASVETTRLYYETKLAEAEEAAVDIVDDAVESYFDWTEADADYEIKQESAEVKQLLYEDEKVRFEKGESTLDDVRDAFTDWSDARTAANSSLESLQTAEADLYTTLNIDPADFDIEHPAEADLFNYIDELEAQSASANLSISGSYAVFSSRAEEESLELELKSTWLFEPTLSITGSVEVPSDGSSPELSATASLSIGLDNWNADERAEIEAELELSRQQTVQTINAEQLTLTQAVTAAETAAINYDAAEVELEQAEELLDEAEFLHELGEYSAAELQETALEYEQSKLNLFSAAAERCTALRTLSGYAE